MHYEKNCYKIMRVISELQFKKFNDEQHFKTVFCSLMRKENVKAFPIETESTILGFPDVLFINTETNEATLAEFKCIRNKKSSLRKYQKPFHTINRDIYPIFLVYSKDTHKIYTGNLSAFAIGVRYGEHKLTLQKGKSNYYFKEELLDLSESDSL